MPPIDLLGYTAGILVVISLLPQLIKSWKTKSTRDISLWRYIIYTTGLVLWTTYGMLVQNDPIAVMNGVGFVFASSILYLKLKYH